MKHIKTIKKFFEDGVANATAAIGGMGAVVAPTVGSLPGVAGGSGSGDIGFVLGVAEKIPVGAAGNPSEVSDLRYLEPAKDVEEVDDLKKTKKKGSKKTGFKRFSAVSEAKDEDDSDSKLEKAVEKFEKDFGTELEGDFDLEMINILDSAFKRFDRKFIKGKINMLILEDMGGVHGKWKDAKTKIMALNPRIFGFKKKFENGTRQIPYREFVIVHEIGHCVDHIDRISYSREWQAISGWKRCDRDAEVPEGYSRYVEKRKGRESAGPKKSNWVSKIGADFCRKYASRNPREDFADSFAFAVFKDYGMFKGEGGEKKLDIVKKVIKQVS